MGGVGPPLSSIHVTVCGQAEKQRQGKWRPPPPRSDCSQNGAATSFAWLLGALPITNFDRLVVTLFTRDISLRAQQTNHQLGALNKRMHSGPFQIVRLLICSFSFSLSPLTMTSLSQICDFWKQLSWPDVVSSYPFVYSIVEVIYIS